ncbi:MAG TPA: ABC transporter permease [Burkholderiales bacterium]
MSGLLRSLWRYRHFVLSSIRNELVTRFARSKLGGLWMIISPLAQVAIYALILSNVLAARLPGIENRYAYAVYLMAGLLAWTLFSDIVTRCLTLFVEQGNLLKKMSFPRITLPAIAAGSSLLNNALLLLAMLGIFALLGHGFTPAMLWLVPLAALVTAFALGIGLALGVINVFVRDVGQAVPIVLQIWFWLTPIVYPASIIGEEHRRWLYLNPLYPVVEAYQRVLLYGSAPDLGGLAYHAVAVAALLLFALLLFRRAAPEMVDAL